MRSATAQSRHFDRAPRTSGLPLLLFDELLIEPRTCEAIPTAVVEHSHQTSCETSHLVRLGKMESHSRRVRFTPMNGHRESGPTGPLSADTVAKVESCVGPHCW
jgi:hypothetical protein